ncbi:MAG TPA: PLP-dependent transferase, partial [Vicingaceae bacterium]|nr:PLP-dependent transferase [Vicingaceae bacterium]
MKQHSFNALHIAKKLEADGQKIIYPGLAKHPQHELMKTMYNEEFGFGGLFVIDMKTKERANVLMEEMQNNNVGYLAVSLGSYKTLFSAPGGSTSSEIPEEERMEMGLTEGLVRVSIGLDNDAERTYQMIKKCLAKVS